LTRQAFREQLALFLSTETETFFDLDGGENFDEQVLPDYEKADKILEMFDKYDPFREAIQFLIIIGSSQKGVVFPLQWFNDVLERGGLSDQERSVLQHERMVRSINKDEAMDVVRSICHGCANMADDCFPDSATFCSYREEDE